MNTESPEPPYPGTDEGDQTPNLGCPGVGYHPESSLKFVFSRTENEQEQVEEAVGDEYSYGFKKRRKNHNEHEYNDDGRGSKLDLRQEGID